VDPHGTVPAAYDALKAKEADVCTRFGAAHQDPHHTDYAGVAAPRQLSVALANEDDAKTHALLREKLTTETANLRTLEAERESVEHEAGVTLAETQEMRDEMDAFLTRFQSLVRFSTAQRRKLAMALNQHVAVYCQNHLPWIEMVCDVLGIEAP
jgi:hypothetical protein